MFEGPYRLMDKTKWQYHNTLLQLLYYIDQSLESFRLQKFMQSWKFTEMLTLDLILDLILDLRPVRSTIVKFYAQISCFWLE